MMGMMDMMDTMDTMDMMGLVRAPCTAPPCSHRKGEIGNRRESRRAGLRSDIEWLELESRRTTVL